MLSQAPQLLITCCLMFFGSMVVGMLPLLMHISDAWMRSVQLMGAGLMIGAALAAVIPEGFAALHPLVCSHESHDSHSHSVSFSAPSEPLLGHDGAAENGHTAEHESCLPQWAAGAALLAGFVFMMCLENAQHTLRGGGGCSHASELKRRPSPPLDDHDGSSQDCGANSVKKMDDPTTVVASLLIHAAADGLAVGAASMLPSTRLAILVGTAMVLHKGPVAFGLTTHLMSVHYSFRQVFENLLLFSAASPATAIMTYLALQHLPFITSAASIALCVLFSGGTFLYAACMHILPHALAGQHMSMHDIAAFSFGCSVTVLFNMGHHH